MAYSASTSALLPTMAGPIFFISNKTSSKDATGEPPNKKSKTTEGKKQTASLKIVHKWMTELDIELDHELGNNDVVTMIWCSTCWECGKIFFKPFVQKFFLFKEILVSSTWRTRVSNVVTFFIFPTGFV